MAKKLKEYTDEELQNLRDQYDEIVDQRDLEIASFIQDKPKEEIQYTPGLPKYFLVDSKSVPEEKRQQLSILRAMFMEAFWNKNDIYVEQRRRELARNNQGDFSYDYAADKVL